MLVTVFVCCLQIVELLVEICNVHLEIFALLCKSSLDVCSWTGDEPVPTYECVILQQLLMPLRLHLPYALVDIRIFRQRIDLDGGEL